MKHLYLFFTLALLFSGKMLKAQSPVMVKNINPSGGSAPFSFTVFKNKLFFAANDGTNGIELWTSDGTTGGTYMVKNVNPSGDGISSTKYKNLVVVNSTLYTMMNDGTHGYELWKSDGTPEGTQLVKDINPGAAGQPTVRGNLIPLDWSVVFFGNDGVHGNELWISNGTEEGTRMIKDLNPNGDGITSTYLYQFPYVYKGYVFFTGTDGVNTGLFKTDGTSDGTTLVKAGLKDIYTFVEFNSDLYFGANDGTNGVEFWKTDGTTEGTVMVKDIRAGSASSYASIMGVFNNLLMISADDGNGTELWKSDGTPDGTERISDISPGSSGPLTGITLGDYYIFPATPNGTTSAYKLYITNGTLENTTLFKDIYIDPALFYHFIINNGTVYFRAKDGENGAELWQTDGTSEGTVIVEDINSGAGNSDPDNFIVLNGTVYFTANDGTNGTELWRLGSAATTGIQSVEENNKIEVFPNPVSQLLTVNASEIQDLESVEVVNSINQKVKELNVSSILLQINTEDLTNGMYFLILKNKAGKTYVKRFVKI